MIISEINEAEHQMSLVQQVFLLESFKYITFLSLLFYWLFLFIRGKLKDER